MKKSLIISLITFWLLSSCSDPAGPDDPITYNKSIFSQAVTLKATTTTNDQGLDLDIIIIKHVSYSLFPYSNSHDSCLTITVLDELGQEKWQKKYSNDEYNYLFCLSNSGISTYGNYTAHINIAKNPQLNNVKKGKITFLMYLKHKYESLNDTLKGDVPFNFKTK